MVQTESRVGGALADLPAGSGRAEGPFPMYAGLVEQLLAPVADPADGEPDPVTAHVLAVLASYAYSGLSTTLEMATRLGLERARGREISFRNDPQFIAATTHVVQSEDGRVVVVAFRGTEPVNLVSWLTDLDISPEAMRFTLPDGSQPELHAGFHRNVSAVWFELMETLGRAAVGGLVDQPGSAPGTTGAMEALYVTGHSLGGAMAALAAMQLRLRPGPPSWLGTLRATYTFGAPMVGTPDLAAACATDPVLARATYRFVYEGDPIPRLPSRDTGRWAHWGVERRFTTTLRSRGWRTSARSVGQLRFVGQLVTAIGTLPLSQLVALGRVPAPYRIDDHLPQHYVISLTPPALPVTEFGADPYVLRLPPAVRARRDVEARIRQLVEVL